MTGPLGVTWLQTEAMRRNGRSLWFGRDYRGRPTTLVSSISQPSPSYVTTHALVWDGASVPAGCPTPTNTIGRIAKATDPVRDTWYSYDAAGRITTEMYLPPGATSCAGALFTQYAYSPAGRLATLTYPHGRLVRYNRNTTARVTSIDVQYDGVYQTTIGSIKWEPFGGLRQYVYLPPGGSESLKVDYQLGDAAGSNTCASAVGTNDLSGRVRAIVATRKNSGVEIMRRNYRWSGSNVSSETICYPGGTDITTTFEYDKLDRLTTATGTNFATSGGPVQSLTYEYDRLGNRSRQTSGTQQLTVTTSANHPNWVTSQASPTAGSKVGYWFHPDGGTNPDGHVGIRSTASDSSNSPGTEYVYGWGEASSTTATSGLQSVVSTMTRRQGSNSQVWNYHYDVRKRRTQKQGPTGLEAEFFWSSNDQMLEDIGPMTGSTQKTLDEFVWLDGNPVIIIRAKLDPATGQHVSDFQADCSRGGVSARCQAYGVVVDRLGRPVLSVDHATLVTGVGEYDPFGHVNRVAEQIESPHPYPATVSTTTWSSTRGQKPHGMVLELRPHFNVFDQESTGNIRTGFSIDYVYVVDGAGTTLATYTGTRGDHWAIGWTGSQWVPSWVAPSDGVLRLKMVTNNRNCLKGSITLCAAGSNQQAYAGFAMDVYEYRRYSTGGQPYFPSYRGPGLYHDQESDQFQNWHRQLDPTLGRYLSSEPLLAQPASVIERTARLQFLTAYAFGLNRPTRFVDRTGRDPGDTFSNDWDAARDFFDWNRRRWQPPMRRPENETCATIRRRGPGNYTYETNDGLADKCTPPDSPGRIANCHIHPTPLYAFGVDRNEAFSPGDDDYFWQHPEYQYLETPSGRLIGRSRPGQSPSDFLSGGGL